jgi:hypothetical protein
MTECREIYPCLLLHAISLHVVRSAAEAGPRVQFGWTVVLNCLVAWLFVGPGCERPPRGRPGQRLSSSCKCSIMAVAAASSGSSCFWPSGAANLSHINLS